jgi:UPF0271 protein
MNATETSRRTASRAIDLNADLGEGFPNDRLLLDLVSSASISCGAHAGDPDAICRTLADARDRGVAVGAHPGYPDREHFGRRERDMASDAVMALVLEQVAVLRELAAEVGVAIRFLKPHGALYNQAQKQAEIARGVMAAAADLGLALLGQPGTLLEELACERCVVYIREGFPDRRYRDDGSLIPRSEPDAILHDPAEMEAQLLRLIAGRRVETLCIHGDDPRAVDNARLVRRVAEWQGLAIRSFTGPDR